MTVYLCKEYGLGYLGLPWAGQGGLEHPLRRGLDTTSATGPYLCSRIRLLEYVRTSRDATAGRISSGLHGTARAALRYGSGGALPRDSSELAADRY